MKKQGVLAGSLGALVLGGVLVASVGSGIAPAEAQTATTSSIIINKLNQILALLTGAAGQQNNHTLRWDTHNPSASRFTTAFIGAVLDNNTGLVWEQAPDATARVWQSFGTPSGATNYCVNKNVGGTRGWRLPSVAELASLIDPSLPAPFVPVSVFTGVQSADYWSASTLAGLPALAWFVNFDGGVVFSTNKASSVLAWCVRGGMNADVY